VDYCMICLEIPDDKILKINITELPDNWYFNPAPNGLAIIGDNFIRRNEYLAIEIPSVIIAEENNILLNPNYKDFSKVKISYKRKIPIDPRFFART